jgi:hypothetical protein
MRRSISLTIALATFGCQRNQTTPAAEQRQPAPPAGQADDQARERPGGGATGAVAPAPRGVAEFADKLPRGEWRGTALARDLDKICNVIAYAGAQDMSQDEQLMATLEWLPRNLESEDGHNFLASIGNLDGNDKADALEAGARRAGLKACPIALKWRQ